jgi:hypothetical protein
MLITPMPVMETQVGLNISPVPFVKARVQFGTTGVAPRTKVSLTRWPIPLTPRVDLNCGWYCMRALLYYWFERINGVAPQTLPLVKSTALAYDPYIDSPGGNGWNNHLRCETGAAIPTTSGNWVTRLSNDGPFIVSGKLGAADWGSIGGHKLGVGHFVLVVGADAANDTLSFKDPLQGNSIRTKDFAHTFARINHGAADDVYYLDQPGANYILGQINAT